MTTTTTTLVATAYRIEHPTSDFERARLAQVVADLDARGVSMTYVAASIDDLLESDVTAVGSDLDGGDRDETVAAIQGHALTLGYATLLDHHEPTGTVFIWLVRQTPEVRAELAAMSVLELLTKGYELTHRIHELCRGRDNAARLGRPDLATAKQTRIDGVRAERAMYAVEVTRRVGE